MLTIHSSPFFLSNMNANDTCWLKTRISVFILNTLSPFHTFLSNSMKKMVRYIL